MGSAQAPEPVFGLASLVNGWMRAILYGRRQTGWT